MQGKSSRNKKRGGTRRRGISRGISFRPDQLKAIDSKRGWMPTSVYIRNLVDMDLFGQQKLNHGNEKEKEVKKGVAALDSGWPHDERMTVDDSRVLVPSSTTPAGQPEVGIS
jgi:hypothetical protein